MDSNLPNTLLFNNNIMHTDFDFGFL